MTTDGPAMDVYYLRTVGLIAYNAIARKYRTSFLGIAWMMMMPVTQVIIFALVMPVIRNRAGGADYVLFLVCTIPLWTFIVGAMVSSSYSLISQSEVIKRCLVSTTVFPVANVLCQLYSYAISFAVMLIVWLAVSHTWNPFLLLVPLYLVPTVVTVGALSIAAAFVTPYVHDVPDFLQVLMSMLFWVTPVVYPLDTIPGRYQHWFYLNPFYWLIRPIDLLVYSAQLPSAADVARLLGVMLASIALSAVVYRLCRRNFVYYL